MKLSLASLLFALAVVPTQAHASYDYDCYAELTTKAGKVHKTIIPRKGASRLAKSLNLYFYADVYDGETPIYAAFKIEDAHDKKMTETLVSEMTRDWDWKFQRQTRYGLLKVECH